jgi:hypothetical protein
MSIQHKLTRGFSGGGESISKTETVSVESVIALDVAVANAVTDGLHALAIDVSQMKTLFMSSTKDVTLETNDGSSPAATVALKAGIPRVWSLASGETNPFGSTDVTALYITNASGAAADIQIRIGVDPTV